MCTYSHAHTHVRIALLTDHNVPQDVCVIVDRHVDGAVVNANSRCENAGPRAISKTLLQLPHDALGVLETFVPPC